MKRLIFIALLLIALVMPKTALADCDVAGNPCCGSRTGGACKIGTGLVCVNGTCRDADDLPPPETCDQDGDTCCTDRSGTTFCLNGLICQSDNSCQRFIDRSINESGSPGGMNDGQNIFCSKNGKQGISTALGCIVVEGTDFVTTLLKFGVGIAGGIAMLLIIFGGFQILTSAGNPERLNEGKELISSAITGLLMIVFSVFLLKIIGVNILGIPSFQ